MLNYYIYYFIISLLGIIYPGPFFNAILILDVIHKFPTLSNLIKAIQNNMKNLFFIGILMGLILYVLSLIANFYVSYLEIMAGPVNWNDEQPFEKACLD